MKNVIEMKNGVEMKNKAGVVAVYFMKPNWSSMYIVTMIFLFIGVLKFM